MHTTIAQIRADFDRLAPYDDEGWSHNSHYYPFLLAHLPARLDSALDVGCGTGAFSRLLARRARHVLAIDLSPRMIEIARRRSAEWEGWIDYRVANILELGLPAEGFDAIASVATLHHLPLAAILAKLGRALKPGGTLVALDLFSGRGPVDVALYPPAAITSSALKLLNGRRESPEMRAAWEAHGQHDVYPTLREVRQACAAALPGARVMRHLLWRYSITWRKPGEG